VNSYTCSDGQMLYRETLPKAGAVTCKLSARAVFNAPNASEVGAVPIFEYMSTAHSGSRVWSANKTPPVGYSLVGSFFHGFAINTTAAVTLPVFPSVLCAGGPCHSFLSLDREQHKACTTWDGTVPLPTLSKELDGYANESFAALKVLSASHPIHGNLGWGVDIVTGGLAQLPVVQLDFSDKVSVGFCPSVCLSDRLSDFAHYSLSTVCLQSRTWHNFLYPKEAAVKPLANPQVECQSTVFQTVGDYTAFVRGQVGKGNGRGGIYGTAFANVLQLFRKNAENADPSLTVTHGAYTIYLTPSCTAPADTVHRRIRDIPNPV
jgi:hypothetical protein